ncbi:MULTISPECIES: hypothetical protein [Nocardiaceae]|nr:hypothetical protein [Rhodococcus fascians]
MYLLDAKLASHIHGHLRIVEVVLRQQMHEALKVQYGARWFDSTSGAGLSAEARLKVAGAYDDLNPRRSRSRMQPAPAADKVVAALMMGFWAGLLRTPRDVDHEATLWVPALEKCLNDRRDPLAPELTMSAAQKILQRLNWARNRVNHCESVIFGFPQPGQRQGGQLRYAPASIIEECRTLVGRFSTDVEAWMRSSTAIDDLIADSAAQNALAYSSAQRGRVVV